MLPEIFCNADATFNLFLFILRIQILKIFAITTKGLNQLSYGTNLLPYDENGPPKSDSFK